MGHTCLTAHQQTGASDTDNFDEDFTREPAIDSVVEDQVLSQTMQKPFVGWSYNRPVAGLGDAGGSVRDPAFGSIQE
jgi:serum/glucocorticoid-regulated kinase 2